MSEDNKPVSKNAAMIAKLTARNSLSGQLPQEKVAAVMPTYKKSLTQAEEEHEEIARLRDVTPAGRKKLPDEEKKKHQVPLYLTDDEYAYLEALGKKHHIKPARMLRVLVDQIGFLKHD